MVEAVEDVTAAEDLGIWRGNVLVEIAPEVAAAAVEVVLVSPAGIRVIWRGIVCAAAAEVDAAVVATAVEAAVAVVLEGLAAEEAAVEATVSAAVSLDTSPGNAKAPRE